MTEPEKRDVASEARRVLRDASRIHALNDSDSKKDEDVSWLLEALADECKKLHNELEIANLTIEGLLDQIGVRERD